MVERDVDVRLSDWWRQNTIDDDLLWKNSASEQMIFVRDYLRNLVATGIVDRETRLGITQVIGTHVSKSITLPVYSLERPDLGIRFVLRDNFYNWKLSVISEKPVEADFTGLFVTSKEKDTCNYLASCYFEGFPSDLIFGHYDESDKRKWSAEVTTNYQVYTTVFLCMQAIGAYSR